MNQLERLVGYVVRTVEDAPRQIETVGRIITFTVVVDGQNIPIGWSSKQMVCEGMQLERLRDDKK
jgi:hypothetical protein